MILSAKSFAPLLALDFAAGVYVAGDRVYPSAAAIGEVAISGPGGIAVARDGSLRLSPAGQPRIAPGEGVLLEPEATNVLAMRNAAPVDIAGWTLNASRPAGATITVVDDRASLEASGIFAEPLAAGVMNGKVIRLYNPSADTDFIVPFYFSVGGRVLASSAYVRCVSGGGNITVTGGGGATPAFSGSGWQRVGRVHSGGQQARFVIAPGSDVRVILAQLEPDRITSPIVVSGAPVRRAADRLSLRGRHLFGQPHSIVIEADADWGQNGARRLLTIGGAAGYAVERGTDGAVSAQLASSFRRPRVPRAIGSGRLRVAHRVSARGHSIAAGGLAGHAPFDLPPLLEEVTVGFAADGSAPINGWVRSIEILPEVDDAILEALAAAPAGSVGFDARRYVSPDGDDAADGMTPATPWRTLARAEASAPWPGTHIHLARGGTWAETLRGKGYVTFRPYGAGAAPRIGIGQVAAMQSAQASDWRLLGLDLTGSTQRGIDSFGASGVMVDECEVHHLGSATDNNSGGAFFRAAGRTATAVIASASGPATLTGIRATEAAQTGDFTLTCTVAGSGGASRWQYRRPDGSIVGTVAGGASYTGAGLTFTISGTGAVGDTIALRSLPYADIPYATASTASHLRVRLTHVHAITGSPTGAGDDLYIEGIGGTLIVEGCTLDAPTGRDADALQIGRCDALYLRAAAGAIVRHNALTAGTSGGKGAMVVRSQTALIEGNWVRGHNFGIGVMVAAGGDVRWNVVTRARLYDYSWGIGSGEDTDVVGLSIRWNDISDCNRGVAMSGLGATTVTLAGRLLRTQRRTDIVVADNIIAADTGLYIDRPTSGRMQHNRLTSAVPIDRRAQPDNGRLSLTLNRVPG